jgi:hypothetical protein
VKKIVRDSILEDVADKAREQMFNIPSDHVGFEKKHASAEMKKKETPQNNILFAKKDDWSLIKNPTSLKDFGSEVRGVILPNGDFYLESTFGSIHQDILKILHAKGVLKEEPTRNWGRKLPQESGFLTVQRYKDSDKIAIGESNRVIYEEPEYEKNRKHYTAFMVKAKERCPNIEFVDKLVGQKFHSVTEGLQYIKKDKF